MNKKYGFETLQVRAGQEIDPVSKGTAVPIYQSTAYTFDSMEYGAELFGKHIYPHNKHHQRCV